MLKTALIIEDHETTAEWFKQSLNEAYPRIEISVCYDYQTARHYLADTQVMIDLVLVDINLPDGSGLDLIRPLLAIHPKAYIVVISVLDDSQHILTAIRRGAKGYLLKGLSKEICIQKMRAISDEEPPLSPNIAQKILQTLYVPSLPPQEPNQLVNNLNTDNLTARETEVLRIIAKGYNRKETSRLLTVSESTIATHIRNIYSKLHISNRSEATVAAYQMNLIC